MTFVGTNVLGNNEESYLASEIVEMPESLECSRKFDVFSKALPLLKRIMTK